MVVFGFGNENTADVSGTGMFIVYGILEKQRGMIAASIIHDNFTMPFPKGFFWGAATASHQVEGNNHNDWTVWERQHAIQLAQASEKNFHWNPHWERFRIEATNPDNYISGAACDHWNRFAEDFDIVHHLGLNAYRFSIEWSRVEPEEGKFDEEALTHYREMIQALHARNIAPFVTLWHWTLPLWLAEEGGVGSPRFTQVFVRYAEKVIQSFGPDIRFWVTLNEPDIYTGQSYVRGIWPPQKKSWLSAFTVYRKLASTHRLTYHAIKKLSPSAQIGVAKHNIWFEAANGRWLNRLLKAFIDRLWNHWFLKMIQNEQDFIGLNHYNHHRIDGWYGKNENKLQTDFGWEYYPESLYHTLIELKQYEKPVYITENGIADASDELRQKFIPAALRAVEKAITEGVDARGYFYWSLLDNFEWDKGYWLRFGLIHVDRMTQKRTIRESAQIYSALIKEYRQKEQ